MFARLIVKALTVRIDRVAVALAAIVVGAAVVSALANLYFDVSIKMSEELRSYGANFYIGPAGGQSADGFDQRAYLSVIAGLPKDRLVGASPYLYGLVRLDRGEAVLAGVSFEGLSRIAPYWQVSGSMIGVDFDDRNCMIGRRLATNLGVGVGDIVRIGNGAAQTQLRVKGIVETGKTEDEQIFVNLPLAQTILGRPGRVDVGMASLLARGPEADALAQDVNRAFTGLEARPIRKISESDGLILGKIEGLMALIAVIILAISTLCVNATLTAMVAERIARDRAAEGARRQQPIGGGPVCGRNGRNRHYRRRSRARPRARSRPGIEPGDLRRLDDGPSRRPAADPRGFPPCRHDGRRPALAQCRCGGTGPRSQRRMTGGHANR